MAHYPETKGTWIIIPNMMQCGAPEQQPKLLKTTPKFHYGLLFFIRLTCFFHGVYTPFYISVFHSNRVKPRKTSIPYDFPFNSQQIKAIPWIFGVPTWPGTGDPCISASMALGPPALLGVAFQRRECRPKKTMVSAKWEYI